MKRRVAPTTTDSPDLTPDSRSFGVPRNVLALGLTSFFADISGEMIYPLIPIFLTTVLGAPVAIIGLIEGVAEGTASIVKALSGWWSDRLGRRMPLVVGGYGLAAVAKLLLAVAFGWPVVLLARFVDRFGKGFRGSPRDALIAESAAPGQRGRAFGFHRSMDTAGAVIGPLLALVLVALLHGRLRPVFAIAVIPGLLGVIALIIVHEPRTMHKGTAMAQPTLRQCLRDVDPRLTLFLVASLIFALGNSSDVFLLLKAKSLGLSTTAVVLAYALYNFVYMGASLPAGVASDRLGRRNVFIAGLLIFAVAYAGFARAQDAMIIWLLFAVYGLYIALTEGVGKAFITDLTPRESRGTVLGAYGMLTGLAALLASVVAGVLWDTVGTGAPFVLGAVAALLSALLLVVALPSHLASPEQLAH